jgi:thymidylate kinase
VTFTVALIGPDGAGKSTIARRLEASFPLPVKRLYMGINTESSNVALPTTRLIERVRQARQRRSGAAPSGAGRVIRTRHKPGGKVWAAVRLANRLAEEWFRQLVSWGYRRRGKIVVYDRHFKFDFETSTSRDLSFSDRVHRWCLAKLYPRPDLVIYLDAPAEVLFARKGEANLHWLEERRQAFLSQGTRTPGFIRVDATQSVEAVYAEVCQQILGLHRARAQATDSSEVARSHAAHHGPTNLRKAR